MEGSEKGGVRAVVVLSGGQDSALCLALAVRRFGAAAVAALVLAAGTADAAERHWRGTDSSKPTLASVAANWVDGDGAAGVPADGDTVVLDADSADKPMTWDLAVAPGGWTQTNYAGTVTFDRGTNAVVVSGDVDLASGTWTHTANPSFSASSYAWTSGRGTGSSTRSTASPCPSPTRRSSSRRASWR